MTNEFKYYNHLRFFNPYYVTQDGKNHIFSNIDEAIKFLPEDPILDPVAIIELLDRNYILGDRTMIQGIQKTPWMARPSESRTDWQYFEELPPHAEKTASPEEIAARFHDLLLSELREYIVPENRLASYSPGEWTAGSWPDYYKKLKTRREILDLMQWPLRGAYPDETLWIDQQVKELSVG